MAQGLTDWVIRRGARVLSSTGDTPNVSHVAVANPNATYVLVPTNRAGMEMQVPCRFEGMETLVTMPANSVVTLQW